MLEDKNLTDVERSSLAGECTEKEQIFVREYVTDLNGTQAVIRSGCFNIGSLESAGVCAARLLSRDRVKALFDIAKAQREARTNMTADSVIHELSLLSHSDLSHYLIGDDGEVKLVEGAPAGAMRAIQSIKRKKTIKEDRDGNVTITYDVELKLWDKPAPLKLMGRHVGGLFPDKVEVTGKNGQPLESVVRIVRVVVNAPPKE